MVVLRFLFLTLLACALLIGCGQIDQAMKYSEQADAVAAKLEDITGIKPSTSASWENSEFREFVIEFDQIPAGIPPDEIRAHALESIKAHFNSTPEKLTVNFLDHGE